MGSQDVLVSCSVGERGCRRCGGWTVYSPEDLAWSCLNCGRLYNTFTPRARKNERAPGGNISGYNAETAEVRRLIVSIMAGLDRPITTRELRQLLTGTRGEEPNYLAQLIRRMREVEPAGRGSWRLRSG